MALKVENVSSEMRYDELSKANTHSRTAYTENTKLKAQVTGTTSRVKPTSGASKTVPKRAPRNHSSMPVKKANARRVEAHQRILNKKNRVDCQFWLVVQIVLWYLDSGCSRHMTGDRARLINFVEKFIGTVRFGNDEYAAIIGYGQFCDGGLEVVFPAACHVNRNSIGGSTKGSRATKPILHLTDDMMSHYQLLAYKSLFKRSHG
ncbi:hypothetical protein Tco_1245608 [Tanacetum coccineum]